MSGDSTAEVASGPGAKKTAAVAAVHLTSVFPHTLLTTDWSLPEVAAVRGPTTTPGGREVPVVAASPELVAIAAGAPPGDGRPPWLPVVPQAKATRLRRQGPGVTEVEAAVAPPLRTLAAEAVVGTTAEAAARARTRTSTTMAAAVVVVRRGLRPLRAYVTARELG